MKVSLNYVHVARPESSDEFNREARRFVETYKQFPAGCEHQLVVICANGNWTDEMCSIYEGVSIRAMNYHGYGWDIGAQQHAAIHIDADLMVSVNSRAYFYRSGWLKRFVECRELHGEGIYSAMASLERCPMGSGTVGEPNPHLRTAFYGMDAGLWRNFPYLIKSRDDSFRFESGEWNIAKWCESQGACARLVTWDGCWERDEWRNPVNGFRNGNQENCPVWDRHVDIFRSSPTEYRDHLIQLASGLI